MLLGTLSTAALLLLTKSSPMYWVSSKGGFASHCSGKSSLVDELVRRFLIEVKDKTLAIISAVIILTIPFVMAYVNGLKIEHPAIATNPEYLKLYHSGNWLDFFKFNLTASFYEQIIVPGYAITAHIVMLACMLFGAMLQKIDFMPGGSF